MGGVAADDSGAEQLHEARHATTSGCTVQQPRDKGHFQPRNEGHWPISPRLVVPPCKETSDPSAHVEIRSLRFSKKKYATTVYEFIEQIKRMQNKVESSTPLELQLVS